MPLWLLNAARFLTMTEFSSPSGSCSIWSMTLLPQKSWDILPMKSLERCCPKQVCTLQALFFNFCVKLGKTQTRKCITWHEKLNVIKLLIAIYKGFVHLKGEEEGFWI